VSLSRAAKPSVPFGGWYRGQEASMWSVVCSYAPHLQFAERTKPHLCIVERNSPTPVHRRGLVWPRKVIPGGEGPGAVCRELTSPFKMHVLVSFLHKTPGDGEKYFTAIPYPTYDLPRFVSEIFRFRGQGFILLPPQEHSRVVDICLR